MLKAITVGWLASLATGVVFVCMHALIAQPEAPVSTLRPLRLLPAPIVAHVPNPPERMEPAVIKRPKASTPIPGPYALQKSAAPKAETLSLVLARMPALKTQPEPPEFQFGYSKRAVAMVRFDARYPMRALMDGVSGHVTVQLAIDEAGRVADAKVVEALPRGYFEEATLRAVRRFKFMPRLVDGVPHPAEDIFYRMDFSIP